MLSLKRMHLNYSSGQWSALAILILPTSVHTMLTKHTMHIASELSQQKMVKLHTVQWKHVEKACDDIIIDQLCIWTNTVCCLSGQNEEIEEGIPYIAGNMLWVVYQFIVVIVLLSILRARMVNTYHRIFKEADVQWKYFRSDVKLSHESITIHIVRNNCCRASIWWKYLDQDTMLPPPFTVLYCLHRSLRWIVVTIIYFCYPE